MGLEDSRAKEFFAGLGSALMSITIIYPITKCIYRQILENASTHDSFLNMKKEGIFYMYRGMGAPMVHRCVELSVMFGVYKTSQVALHPLSLCHYQERLISSATAGAVESIFTPFERLEVLLVDARNNKRFRNMPHTAFVIGTQYGIKEYYRGYRIILYRNVFHNMVFFTVKERIYEYMDSINNLQKTAKNFLVGAMVGTCVTFLFFPIRVVKVHVQQQIGGDFPRISDVLMKVYARENGGIRNFYRGFGLNIIRAIFSWGIANTGYEFLRTNL